METKELVRKFVMDIKEGKAQQARETLKQVMDAKLIDYRMKNNGDILTK
jgi:hypothetical protein